MGTIIKPKLILSDCRTLFRGKAVRISNGLIDEIGDFDKLRKSNSGDKVYELDNAAVLPGLTNAHCHLELDWCEGKIKYNGNFLDWLQSIRDIKFSQNPPTPNPFPSITSMLKTGTTTLIDHYSMPLPMKAIQRTGLRYFPLREMFEFNNHSPISKEVATKTSFGFAVHSPYTTSREIALTCKELSEKWRRPISTHLSEMRDEIDFIKRGNSAHIDKLHLKGDTFDSDWRGVGSTPVEYFYKLGILNRRTYGIHLNYWEDNDLYYLAKSGLTPVFCPKSHRYFQHPHHPIEEYRRSGLYVALGTDSLASNDALSIIEEAKLVAEEYPYIPLSELFNSITVYGLRPLGLNARLGIIKKGNIADVTVWNNISGDSPDEVIREIILERDSTLLTMVNGLVRYVDMSVGGV